MRMHRFLLLSTALASLFTSHVTYSFTPTVAPRFDVFCENLVGHWNAQSDEISLFSGTVTEVMRSCGGAIQGVREISLDNVEKEGNYLNRANDGFVFWDDGTYSAGPVNDDSTKEDEYVCWTSLSLSHQTRVLVRSKNRTDDSEANIEGFFLWKDGADPCNVVQQRPPEEMDWTYQKRCRMPSLSQPWMLQRAKWELSGKEAQSIAPFKAPTLWVRRDANDDGVDVSTGCFCPETGEAVAVVRSHQASGSLSSVTCMRGSIQEA